MDDIYDILVEEYGLTPEQVDELMELGVLAGEQGSIVPRQQKYAEELRGARRPRGRSYGGVYEEAHPLEFLGAGLKSTAGHYGEWKAQQRQEEILREQAKRRAAYLRGMRGPQSLGPPGAATPQAVDLPQGTPHGEWQPYIGPQPSGLPPAGAATPRAVNVWQGTPYSEWQPYIGPQPLNTRR